MSFFTRRAQMEVEVQKANKNHDKNTGKFTSGHGSAKLRTSTPATGKLKKKKLDAEDLNWAKQLAQAHADMDASERGSQVYNDATKRKYEITALQYAKAEKK